jgi:hypothetical protein
MLDVVNPGTVGTSTAVALFIGIMLAIASGRWIGRRHVARYGTHTLDSVVSLETAVFALLGLLIAFTFSGALTRFDLRRAQIVDEANAIGTAYLRIELLPGAAQAPLRAAFRDYVDARLATYRKLPDVEAARRELARSQELQWEIWNQAIAAVQMQNVRPGTEILIMPALNQVFDIATVRVFATQMHPPLIIYAMLFALALASAFLVGYQTAFEKGYDVVHQVGFAAIVAFTLYVILDIEYPRAGWIRLDAIDEALVNVRAGMK